MRPLPTRLLAVLVCLGAASCSQSSPERAATTDSGDVDEAGQADVAMGADAGNTDGGSIDGGDGGGEDASDGDGGDGCFLTTVGVYGQCITTATCAAMDASMSTAGYCPGPADIQCCTQTPSVADNPPVPTGWVLMQQSAVTPAMTTWAVAILDDPTMYPMFSTTIMAFGTLMVLARVEWHPPDFQNSAIHRGVTLYQPI